MITKEQIIELYINQNLSKRDVAELLNTSLHTLSKYMKKYNIIKDRKLILELREKTNLDRYGVTDPNKLEEVKQQIKETNLKKYGAGAFVATRAGQKQSKETKKKRYGDETYNNISKHIQTKKIRYGDSKYNNREKMKETMQERYGVDNPFQLQETKEIILDTMFDNNDFDPRYRELINNRDKAIEYLKGKNFSYFDIAKDLNISYASVQMWATKLDLKDYINFKFDGKSSYEDAVYEFLLTLGFTNILRNNKKILDGVEMDLYVPDRKVGIEFNGTYWHSDLYKKKHYHYDKSILAYNKDIRLIHIYQYEWDDPLMQEKIKSLLKIALGKIEEKIYARNCEVRKIDDKTAKEFNNKHHLQNHKGAKVTYGLFYYNKLVQLMSFSKHKTYEWEIIRGCPGSNNIVIGGVSKLFTHFVREYQPNNVFSYCDFNKFDGKSYEILGFNLIGHTGPDLKYIVKDKVINRQWGNYSKVKGNIDAKLHGAGSKRYLWENK